MFFWRILLATLLSQIPYFLSSFKNLFGLVNQIFKFFENGAWKANIFQTSLSEGVFILSSKLLRQLVTHLQVGNNFPSEFLRLHSTAFQFKHFLWEAESHSDGGPHALPTRLRDLLLAQHSGISMWSPPLLGACFCALSVWKCMLSSHFFYLF